MSKKKPTPAFEVLFDGPGVVPENISWSTLNQSLSAVKRLVSGEDAPDEDEVEIDSGKESEPTSPLNADGIQLLDVRRGSAIYRFVSPNEKNAREMLRLAGETIDDPNRIGDRHYILNPVARLSNAARSMNCKIILRDPTRKNGVLATIVPSSYKSMTETVFISGVTSFAGVVERAGGSSSMRCSLRVPFQGHLLYCSVSSRAVSRKLGEYLYHDVSVDGTATWLKSTWKVMDFVINNVTKLDTKPLSESFKALRAAGGDGWDSFDSPESILEKVGS